MIYAVVLLSLVCVVLTWMYIQQCKMTHEQAVIAEYSKKLAEDLQKELADADSAFDKSCNFIVSRGEERMALIVARDDAVQALQEFKRRNPDWR